MSMASSISIPAPGTLLLLLLQIRDSLLQFLFRSLNRTFSFLQRQFRFFSHYSPMILHPFVNPPCLHSTTLPHCNNHLYFFISYSILLQSRSLSIFHAFVEILFSFSSVVRQFHAVDVE